MEEKKWMPEDLTGFVGDMKEKELSDGTVEKYLRDVRNFAAWLGDREVTHENAMLWRAHLTEECYAPATINSMIASVNGFFGFMGWTDCKIRTLRIQRRMFRDRDRELTRTDYEKLVSAAQRLGKDRLRLLLETICSTGIRVSEVKYITVENVKKGRADISLKGKIRTILIPGKLAKKLKKYAQKQKIASGEIFLTKSGKSLSRKQIWAEMKALCAEAGVEPGKVFPHNLRHLFATSFYKACKDIVRLADVLGHSSVETTRIYLLTTGEEHRKLLGRLGLVS